VGFVLGYSGGENRKNPNMVSYLVFASFCPLLHLIVVMLLKYMLLC